MRILGIDYGTKKIGLAFGDGGTRIAVPLEVMANVGAATLQTLADKVSDEDIGLVVVGVPLATGGHHGPEQLEMTRRFIEKLRGALSVDVVEADESYTTSQSIHLQREQGSKVPEDALAAMLILQTYLSNLPE